MANFAKTHDNNLKRYLAKTYSDDASLRARKKFDDREMEKKFEQRNNEIEMSRQKDDT